jgi:hypothetical protein
MKYILPLVFVCGLALELAAAEERVPAGTFTVDRVVKVEIRGPDQLRSVPKCNSAKSKHLQDYLGKEIEYSTKVRVGSKLSGFSDWVVRGSCEKRCTNIVAQEPDPSPGTRVTVWFWRDRPEVATGVFIFALLNKEGTSICEDTMGFIGRYSRP